MNIGITGRYTQHPETLEISVSIDIAWFRFCSSVGITPIILPAISDLSEYFKSLKIEGVILTGGNDLSACNSSDLSKYRDELEAGICEIALRESLPLIGVCRGMQFINWIDGGGVEQVRNHVAVHHDVNFLKGSAFEDFYGSRKLTNSYHDFAVTKVGRNGSIEGVSQDGAIEAMKFQDRNWYGIMWHPERNSEFCKDDVRFFQSAFLK